MFERASTTGTRNATDLDASPAPCVPRGCGGHTLGGPYNSTQSAPSMTHCIKQVGVISPNGILSRDSVLSPRTNRVSNDRPRMRDLSPTHHSRHPFGVPRQVWCVSHTCVL